MDFVYYGEVPVDSASEESQLLLPYALGVLDACGVANGPAHIEIILTGGDEVPLSPCLVELNCRCHGGGGLWIPLAERLCGGYSQTSATLDAYLDTVAFDALPMLPPSPYLCSGAFVCLVANDRAGGIVKATPGYEVIERLESFVALNRMVVVGEPLRRTIDLFTVAGMAVLAHQSAEVLARDVSTIRDLESRGCLFETTSPPPPAVRVHRKKIGFGPPVAAAAARE